MCAKWQNVCTEMAQAHYKVQAQVKPLPLLPLSVAMWEKKKKQNNQIAAARTLSREAFTAVLKKPKTQQFAVTQLCTWTVREHLTLI